MRCPNCDAEIDEDSKDLEVCPECGDPLDEEGEDEPGEDGEEDWKEDQ